MNKKIPEKMIKTDSKNWKGEKNSQTLIENMSKKKNAMNTLSSVY